MNNYEEIKKIDLQMTELEEQIENLLYERRKLKKENEGWFIERYSTGNGDRWTEHYIVPRYKKVECDLKMPDEDWDPGIAFYGEESPYLQVPDEEYENWRRLAQLIEFDRQFDSYKLCDELRIEVFGETAFLEYENKLNDLIDEYYEKVGLKYRSFQRVRFE